jgi:murein DD-endopeptidase MepM/ murein hydrolase activator NlpD
MRGFIVERGWIFGVILTLLVVAASAVGQRTAAQEAGFATVEEAMAAAVEELAFATGEVWELGEIETAGSYAIAIARVAGSGLEESDFALLMAEKQPNELWYAIAPGVVSNDVYNDLLARVPDSLIDPFGKAYYYLYSPQAAPLFAPRASSLHRLPWPIRQEAVVTQKDGSYHTNQVDFVVRDSPMVYASKPGVVVFVKEVSTVGGCDIDLWPWANMVVVQHSDAEFTWYVHLKANSVPVKVGDLIGYGTMVGEQGNTGFACGSTGIHLHFMVSTAKPSSWTDPSVPNHAPWPPTGSIVKIDFNEASWASLTVGIDYLSNNASPPGICSTSVTQVNYYDNTYCSSLLNTRGSAGLVNLGSLGFADKIESIEIPAGWSVALYANENEIGNQICLNATDEMLWNEAFINGGTTANGAAWMRVYTQPNCPYQKLNGIVVYSEPNYDGNEVWGMIGARTTNGPRHLAGSIYLPSGYSVWLYDQDDKAGNSLCLNGSMPDMAVLGWEGVFIESVKLVQGDECGGLPPAVPAPVLVKPSNAGNAYTEYPELCWQISGDSAAYEYNVEVTGGVSPEVSGWIDESCWVPPGVTGKTGTYSWKVQARDSEGQVGPWSASFSFSLVSDTGIPTVVIQNLSTGSQVVKPRASLEVLADDPETRVARVHFFAWYDDGSAAGYDWHYLGVEEDGSDGWKQAWPLAPVWSGDAAVWVYAEDLAGNFNSALVSGIIVASTQTSEFGYDARGNSGGEDNGAGEVAPVDPADLPELPTPPEMPVTPEQPETNEGNSGVDEIEDQPASPPVNSVENNPPAGSGSAASEIIAVQPVPAEALSPTGGMAFFQAEAVNLCWQAANQAGTSYRVRVTGAAAVTSGWMQQSCWAPGSALAASGDYQWQVKTRSADGLISEWGQPVSFVLTRDDTAPAVTRLRAFVSGEARDLVSIEAEAVDQGSGIEAVYFLAWYDDGSGAGWHQLGSLPGTGEGRYAWQLATAELYPQDVLVWVYVRDRAGNLANASSGIVRVRSETAVYPKSMRDVRQ